MTTHRFKIGDRVKWRDCEGRELSGAVVVAADERGQVTVREHSNELYVARWHESHLSLDVPEQKQFATNREAELGMEIIRLNAQIIDQSKANAFIVSRMTAEIGNGHRERFAKEAALMGEALALDSLREIAKTLGDQSFLTAQGLREKTPALAKYEMKRLNAAQKELADLRWALKEIAK